MKSSKTRIGKRMRFTVLRRDGFRCAYCGTTAAASQLHVDHIVPSAAGGSTDLGNLVTACVACNLGKSDTVLPAAAARSAPHLVIRPAVLPSRLVVGERVESVVAVYRAHLATGRDTAATVWWSIANLDDFAAADVPSGASQSWC